MESSFRENYSAELILSFNSCASVIEIYGKNGPNHYSHDLETWGKLTLMQSVTSFSILKEVQNTILT